MEESSQWPKILVAVVLFGVAGTYGYSKYSKLQPSAAINNGATGDFDRAPNPEQRVTMQQEMVKAANITPDQQKKLEKIREEANGDWGQMREKLGEVLTPEQRDKLRENFAGRRAEREAKRDAEARAALPKADYETYKAKQEERRQQRRNGGGGNRGPGGGGPRQQASS